jgi:hypothetical protein
MDMSLTRQHRMNTMYSSTAMVKEREAPKPRSPVGAIKDRHVEELRGLSRRQQEETAKLHNKHQIQRNNDKMILNGQQPHESTITREQEELDKLSSKHTRQTRDLKESHRLEIERAHAEHGIAP